MATSAQRPDGGISIIPTIGDDVHIIKTTRAQVRAYLDAEDGLGEEFEAALDLAQATVDNGEAYRAFVVIEVRADDE